MPTHLPTCTSRNSLVLICFCRYLSGRGACSVFWLQSNSIWLLIDCLMIDYTCCSQVLGSTDGRGRSRITKLEIAILQYSLYPSPHIVLTDFLYRPITLAVFNKALHVSTYFMLYCETRQNRLFDVAPATHTIRD